MTSVRSSGALPGGASLGTATVWGQPYAVADAIAEAKHEWLTACADGSSSARVQRLYAVYRDLVIGQAATAMQAPTAHAS